MCKKREDRLEIDFLQSRWTRQVSISLLLYPHSYFLETQSLSEYVRVVCTQPRCSCRMNEFRSIGMLTLNRRLATD